LDSQEHLALQAVLVYKELLVSKELSDLLENLASRAVQAQQEFKVRRGSKVRQDL